MYGMNTASNEKIPASTAVIWPFDPIPQDRVHRDVALLQRCCLIVVP
jgi:hypothetical protein